MPKIVSPQRSHINTFAYTDCPWSASADVYFITTKDKSTPIKYVLGLLNSKLIYFWLYHRGKRKGEMLELYLTPLSEIPLYKYSPFLGEKIIHLVETIMISKKQTPLANTKHLENKIDIIVYKLYNLTYEEVQIIDPEIEKIISEKEYEKMEI